MKSVERVRRVITTLVLASVFIFLSVFGGLVLFSQNSVNLGSASEDEERVRQIVASPGSFGNQEVFVSGDIIKIVGARSFTISSPGFLQDDLLVVSKQSLQPVGGSFFEESLFRENDRVNITGQVRRFKISEIEQILDISLDRDSFRAYEGKPVILAEEVSKD